MRETTLKRFSILFFALIITYCCVIPVSAADAEATAVRLRRPESGVNTPFAANNLFPGDARSKDFIVKVSHKEPVSLYYGADILPGSEKLAEVLMVIVELPDKGLILYDGLMREMPEALEYRVAAEEKEVRYRITAWLENSVGNDYQHQSLTADFRWWYAQEDNAGGGPGVGENLPDNPVIPGTPDTGDRTDLLPYMGLISSSGAALVLICLLRKKIQEGSFHE